jgi:hypothetical protein
MCISDSTLNAFIKLKTLLSEQDNFSWDCGLRNLLRMVLKLGF